MINKEKIKILKNKEIIIKNYFNINWVAVF